MGMIIVAVISAVVSAVISVVVKPYRNDILLVIQSPWRVVAWFFCGLSSGPGHLFMIPVLPPEYIGIHPVQYFRVDKELSRQLRKKGYSKREANEFSEWEHQSWCGRPIPRKTPIPRRSRAWRCPARPFGSRAGGPAPDGVLTGWDPYGLRNGDEV